MTKKNAIPAKQRQGSIADDLNTLHNECEGLLAQAHSAAQVLRDPVVHAHGSINELTKLGTILQGDLSSFTSRLSALKTQHPVDTEKDPTGDKFIMGAHVGMQYQEWMEEYQSTVIPIQMRIVQLGSAAHAAALASQSETDAQNEPVAVADTHTIP